MAGLNGYMSVFRLMFISRNACGRAGSTTKDASEFIPSVAWLGLHIDKKIKVKEEGKVNG